MPTAPTSIATTSSSTPTTPNELLPHPDSFRSITNGVSQLWLPALTLPFGGSSSSFLSAVDEMILHPEHTSTWILRAEILYSSTEPSSSPPDPEPHSASVPFFTSTRSRTRRLLPRNPANDAAAIQSILQLSASDGSFRELYLLLPHGDINNLPFYLPKVAGVGFLFTPSNAITSPAQVFTQPNQTSSHRITLLYAYKTTAPNLSLRLSRTATRLLTRAKKLGENPDYQKRVHHDVIIRRETYQDKYIVLRERHAQRLLEGWRENTDPKKHVYEDIGIATFLICLWEEMYQRPQLGFVDMGCGNGVLVDILLKEGWTGFGFDARARKSWDGFDSSTRAALKEGILVPWLLPGAPASTDWEKGLHDGQFEIGAFIIANHADELTGWAPLLAKACNGAFLAIPCCSHDLSGEKKRKMPGQSISNSTYAGLVAWTQRLAAEMWEVETEILRIPSTRNAGIVGRRVKQNGLQPSDVLAREGGAAGWVERAEKLRRSEAGGH
ncbi:DUF1613-domain-containing protein [Ascodesmis nigricans]|uniref:tRNA (uracil-O(2)-)-methyltransferase n=1 Tax=Ascodesmis nigricans TaxID=341454 RepID=A0A4S2N043_9PEZI|nr:DUF1613-domain-containing protein [Ascodesmis nigricans]